MWLRLKGCLTFKNKPGLRYQCSDDFMTHTAMFIRMFKYQCKECDYKATQLGSLKLHQKSIHKGVKHQQSI